MSAVTTEERSRRVLLSSEIDQILTAQLVVAWAGEYGESPRLKWWQTDLVSEFGGQDLFQELLPSTWEWAALQSVREAARRCDAELRQSDNDPDLILSLFHLGFAIDERTDERLLDFKRSGVAPVVALPGLKEVLTPNFHADQFGDWVQGHGKCDTVPAPIGRRLKGEPPESPDLLVNRLVAACWPLSDKYPLPHFRRGR